MTDVDDALIHKIYGSATGEVSWGETLKGLIQIMNGECAGIVLHSIAPVRAEVIASTQVEPDTQHRYVTEYVVKNPVMNCLSAMPLGFVTYGSGAVDESFYFDSDFYNAWQKPAGYADNLGIALARRAGEFVLLSIPRNFQTGLYTPDDVKRIKPYVSHLVRAFNIWARLNVNESRMSWVSEALDQVSKGIIILGEDRLILYANKAGEDFLLSGAGVERQDFRLHLKGQCRTSFEKALIPFENGSYSDCEQYVVTVPRPNRSPVQIRVQPPLGRRPGQKNLGLPNAVAFLHVVDPETAGRPDVRLFAMHHGLTEGETRFLQALVETESVLGAAQFLSISEPTARTHARNCSEKTQTANFAALIAAVYRFELAM